MKKKIIFNTVLICALLLFAALWLQGCTKSLISLNTYNPIGITKLDTIRIFNLLADSTKSPTYACYVLYVNDTLYYTPNARSYGNTADTYGTLPAIPVSPNGGTYVFKLARYINNPTKINPLPTPKPDPTKVIYTSPAVTVAAHSGFSNMVFYVDANGAYNSQYFAQGTTTEAAPAPGKFKVRVVNFGYHIPAMGPFNDRSKFPLYPLNSAGKKFAVQLQYADSTIVSGMSNIPFAAATPYVQLDYGTQQLLVYNTNTDSLRYINNSYSINNMTDAFGMTSLLLYGTPPARVNQFPYYTNINPGGTTPPPGTAMGNIASYPFNAGGVYTIYIFGNMYNAVLDKQYGAGTLDNFGKVQIVNANFNQADMQVSIQSQSGTVNINSLAFGKYTVPTIVPAGNVTVTFSAGGYMLYTYQTQVPRLANYTFYYTSNLNNNPVVFPQSNNLNTPDFNTNNGSVELAKINYLNLSPDAGPVFVTTSPLNSYDSRLTSDFSYESIMLSSSSGYFDARALPSGKIADVFNVRLSSSRTDSLVSKLVSTASRAALFRQLPAPGTYTFTLAGLLNTTDPNKKLRIIMVKQSNYIAKVQ